MTIVPAVPRRYAMVCNGVRQFIDCATMTQVRLFYGVVTSDGKAETKFGTFEFQDVPPPAGTRLEMFVHFRNGTLAARSIDEVKACVAADAADYAARQAVLRAANEAKPFVHRSPYYGTDPITGNGCWIVPPKVPRKRKAKA